MRTATARGALIWTLAAATAALSFATPAAARMIRDRAPSTIRIVSTGDVSSLDPAYGEDRWAWQIEYATCLKLVNFPDAEAPRGSQLVPEAAIALPRISPDGLTYEFELRRGLRSNLGRELTALNFDTAFHRVLYFARGRSVSPSAQLLDDVAGAADVVVNKARRARGIEVLGRYRLRITLRRRAGDFLARLALPYFCAVHESLPLVEVGDLESWGPYYVYRRVVNRSIELRRNTFYRGPRPQGAARVVVTVAGFGQPQALDRVAAGAADYTPDEPDAARAAAFVQRFGVNRSRYFVRPRPALRFLALNSSSALFKDNPQLRRAVNYAIDRPAMLRPLGPLAGRRTDQILPFAMPGFREADVYPLGGADFAAAKRLATGHTRAGTANVAICARGDEQLRQVVAYGLEQIGIRATVYCPRRDHPPTCTSSPYIDIEYVGWQATVPDPYDALTTEHTRLEGTGYDAGSPLRCFASDGYARRLATAQALPGARRLAALGRLDAETMRRDAPIVPLSVPNERFLVGPRVTGVVYSPVFGVDIAALRLR